MTTTCHSNKKLTLDQQMFVCSLIDHWYFKWKTDKELHNHIGVAKEELKRLICENISLNVIETETI